MGAAVRIGLDFDNTLAGYDDVFASAGAALGLLPASFAGCKRDVRETLRSQPEGESAWMRLQGRVYGMHMHEAALIAGADGFLRSCRARGAEVFVVSHKSRFGHFDPDRVDLREAALAWMEAQGFFAADGFGIPRRNVFFADTRAGKVARIAALGCDVVVDDLEEVFREPGFPAGVRKILFDPASGARPESGVLALPSWKDIEAHVFAD